MMNLVDSVLPAPLSPLEGGGRGGEGRGGEGRGGEGREEKGRRKGGEGREVASSHQPLLY